MQVCFRPYKIRNAPIVYFQYLILKEDIGFLILVEGAFNIQKKTANISVTKFARIRANRRHVTSVN